MTDDADSGRPATFTSWLRCRSDSELDALVAARPDLITPVPADIAALAARATARPAVLRVLDQLDRFCLQVLEGLVALGDDRRAAQPGVRRDQLAAALGEPGARLDDALSTLQTVALVWDDAPHLRPVTMLRDILSRPAGLGPPLRALLGTLPMERLTPIATTLGVRTGGDDPADRIAREVAHLERLPALLSEAGTEARPVLDRLAWGPPNGTVSGAERAVRPDTHAAPGSSSPIDRLLARALLVPTDDSTVVLPMEVGLHLRGGLLFRTVETAAPALHGPERSAASVTRGAAGQAFTAIRSVEELLDRWAGDPPGVLRNGGLGVRDLRRAAQALDTDKPSASLLVEVAHAAGLLAAEDGMSGVWLPTHAYDVWRESAPEQRWLALAEAWLRTARVASLSGSKDARDRPRNVLGEGLDRRSAPDVRLDVLRALASAPEGVGPTRESVAERLAWLRPRRQGPAYDELLDAALREAATLGMTGAGALAPHARALLEESGSHAAETLATEMPQPATHILLQGDLTAVAPGPLVPRLARELALAADVESTGGATVYRFSADSVRRALDAGRGADDLVALLERHSRTPLPQPLRYLIADTGRGHGRLRAGTASSYLRCDEPTALDELVSDTRTSDLLLTRLAPTVLASRTSRPILLERLNDLGYHVVAESADGSVQIGRPEAQRASDQPASSELNEPTPADPELRSAAVRAIRAGDEAATAGPRPVPAPDAEPPRSPTASTLTALTSAVTRGIRVWIGYLDSDGRASSRIVQPARVDGGYLTAYDATRAAVQRFAVHRITGVADLDLADH